MTACHESGYCCVPYIQLTQLPHFTDEMRKLRLIEVKSFSQCLSKIYLDPLSSHLMWFWRTPQGNLNSFCRALLMESRVLWTVSSLATAGICIPILGIVNTSYWSCLEINIRGLLRELVGLKILSHFLSKRDTFVISDLGR